MKTLWRALIWPLPALWAALTWPVRIFARGRDRETLVALRRPVADAGEGWALWLIVALIVVCAVLSIPGAVE